MRRVFNLVRQQRLGGPAPAMALILLLAGLAMALLNESANDQQKQREIGVQAQILAASVAPALMFDDSAAAQQYLAALSTNPNVEAAGVYNAAGARIAAFARANAAPAPDHPGAEAVRLQGGRLIAETPVMRDGARFGAVYLRTNTDPLLRRISRYAGIAILIVMAALVLLVMGQAQGALAAANAQLTAKARDLQTEIEEREKAEEALLQSRKMEAIGQLTGGVAHDFNNLLMVVLSGIRMLERQDTPERRAKTMEAMRQAVERGSGLTRQLLAFARRQTLSLEAVDISRQLSGMRELLERSLRADILVDMQLPGDLWPVKTDPAQFELAILNLAVNARDAMPKGGVITVSGENVAGAHGDSVRITVRDTGIGISPDIRNRVFEPYFTTKQTGQGTGLGLSQVYGFATQSGGRIELESAVNQGSAFHLYLPRSDVAPPAPAQTARAAPARRQQSANILVVEDDDNVAAFVNEMLVELGYRPTRVSSASAALGALANNGRFDLVFSDIVMPGGMDGIELAREIRRRRPALPIVLSTGYSGGPSDAIEFPLMRKPYQIDDLQQVMEAALRSEGRA
ncbi:MAG TPA: ATP-binding protein [Caulobacterales bacterium]|nr:ATP-binding protein [Caulobacterales bacterium]